MKKSRRIIYAAVFLAVNLLCIILLLVPVMRRRTDLKEELEAGGEVLRLKEERLRNYEASRESFADLTLLAARLENSILPPEGVTENIVALCYMFEESGLELTGCFAGSAEKMESAEEYEQAMEYESAEGLDVLKQTVSLEGNGSADSVYGFIEGIENSEQLYRIEGLNLTAGSDFSEDGISAEEISVDIDIAMFVQAENFNDE